MNCELCQELISDLLDGSLSREDQLLLNAHLEQCLSCAEVRDDLNLRLLPRPARRIRRVAE